uniref:Riboflavin kinase n=2 Tax=Eremothecium gossypii (strain ATCC 10895 / CBS 109.51 / FGSC 9923 / NRRL Y-1056) TaxID=284811 RepID=RIFK_EREGS|nr:RecName: Full=Riboflavin kinase; AltName: Full=Flavin mononucleotide kinase 1 [Eremothecium gossypii ATCC 10895]
MARRPVDIPIPASPVQPFPILTEYVDIVAGFGRGSAELGIPTANVPIEQLPSEVNEMATGVYFGWARLRPNMDQEAQVHHRNDGSEVIYNFGSKLSETERGVFPIVLSVGWNPFYNNSKKTVELHILNDFEEDFYGAKIKFSFLGYIRPELNYTTKEALIEDIHTDIKIASEVLHTEPYSSLKNQL